MTVSFSDLPTDYIVQYVSSGGFLYFCLTELQTRLNVSVLKLQIETRMNKISTDRPETFIEAVQLLFSFHCCLHLSGEPTSIGRLDQLLEPFLKGTPTEEAQEIIDCLFIKLCEHVHLNTRLLNDLSAWGMTAVVYCSTGMFPNGDTINQWVQQVRIIRVCLYDG